MITFITSILILIAGYFIYGKYVEKKFGADDSIPTPVKTMADGVDYVELPLWRIFMIQLLNIAGLGPIFGAILGAKYGESAYIWIVFGCIFMGATHDYISGMMSIRQGGASISEIIGKYLGNSFKGLSRIVTLLLVIIVGAAFVNGPASLLTTLSDGFLSFPMWVGVIMLYYILATLLPIDKVIGRIYPFFGAVLLIMAFGIGGYMLFSGMPMTEISSNVFHNYQLDTSNNIMFPMIFIVISCGAISGFHSTQSPLMARCLKKESQAKKAFFGAMIAEGILALIWATAAINYFGGPEQLNQMMAMPNHNPAWLVNEVCNSWLGHYGAILAIIGVVACPITSGDTAYRSARLLLSDIFKIDQKSIIKRLLVALPVFILGFGLSQIEFTAIWKYLGILNQSLAVIVLWTGSAYFAYHRKNHWFVTLPATFLTFIVAMYFVVAPNAQGGLFLSVSTGYAVGTIAAVAAIIAFLQYAKKLPTKSIQ